MATYSTIGKWALRKLTGSSVIADIDAGFAALADDIDPKLTPWSAGTWAARPAATKSGQRYYVTDLGYEVVADGTNWLLTGSVGVGDFVETMRTSDPPGGFLMLSDGRSIVRASVPAYSAIIGGSSTNIILPDLRGRGTVAPSNMGGPNQTGNDRVQVAAAAVVGEVAHTLTGAESGTNGNGTGTATIPYTRGSALGTGPGGHQTGTHDFTENMPGTVDLDARNADTAHNTVHPVVGVNKLIRVK